MENLYQRIAASGVIIKDDKVLLVRYKSKNDGWLVGPGGGVEMEEDIKAALIREVQEETGVNVTPSKILFIEDLLSKKYRVIKIWFLCEFISGELVDTKEALIEGITEVSWFSKEDIENEIVFPKILKEIDWEMFFKDSWECKYLDLVKADF
ncbi:TPA: hypothetical protein DEO28_00155 [Candidatus Dependentiae bacterium]|nr:MAG: ADP-ribose pyrophosphatase [candidate division TM6 bacterium GW2011_GWE2_31_21]KKP54009.1 MAG: ADP-ribose pyrophosphatase [candidate division TM6 bacterium GW2011_GWF2_33_332]HBS48410.1 hypothetical protein [Candidatus Dependentiae bacterium]HBZ72916.1 hypothetical protein [Candidatus Dependentiae bacterium]